MPLRTALRDGCRLRPSVRNGLGALVQAEIRLIAVDQRPRVEDSLDLDEATREEHPNDHRWDYLLSIRGTHDLVGVEPHSPRDAEIRVVIAKKRNAVDYLRGHLAPNRRVDRWYWVSRGPVLFSATERARRLLDQHGIAFVGRMLRDLNQ
jgi:hypothetical protein